MTDAPPPYPGINGNNGYRLETGLEFAMLKKKKGNDIQHNICISRSYCFKGLIFLFSSNGAVGSGGAGGWTAPQANVRSLASTNAWHHARQADNCFVTKVEYGY